MNELANVIQLELKYCERCGGLWLRRKGSDLVFCVSCTRVMAGPLSHRPGFPSPDERRFPGAVESGFWNEGGNA